MEKFIDYENLSKRAAEVIQKHTWCQEIRKGITNEYCWKVLCILNIRAFDKFKDIIQQEKVPIVALLRNGILYTKNEGNMYWYKAASLDKNIVCSLFSITPQNTFEVIRWKDWHVAKETENQVFICGKPELIFISNNSEKQ